MALAVVEEGEAVEAVEAVANPPLFNLGQFPRKLAEHPLYLLFSKQLLFL